MRATFCMFIRLHVEYLAHQKGNENSNLPKEEKNFWKRHETDRRLVFNNRVSV